LIAGADSLITADHYEAIGGVVGSLQTKADQVVDLLVRGGYGQLVVPTLLKLVRLRVNEEPTRRSLPINLLDLDQRAVVDAFVDARLMTINRAAAEPGGEVTVEIVHEALARRWAPLRKAIEANRVWLYRKADIERLAVEWQWGGRDESYLLKGSRLADLDQFSDRDTGKLESLEREFLQASQAAQSQAIKAARRQIRRLRILLLIVCIESIALMVIAFYSYRS
jgi:hypothetical protein